MQPDRKPVIVSVRASKQLDRLHRWVVKDSSLERADAFLRAIRVRMERIALVPEQGARLPKVHPRARQTGYERRVSILFRVDADKILILAIAYGGRLMKNAM